MKIIPLAPNRQCVISFAVLLKFWFQTNKKLYSQVHKIVIREIQPYYKNKAISLGVKYPLNGTNSYTLRFGSDPNLNQQNHCLALDGVFTDVAGVMRFYNTPAIRDQEVATLIT